MVRLARHPSLVALLALGGLFACTGSDDSGQVGSGSGGTGGTGGATSCPISAPPCASGCELITGQPIDFDKSCLGPSQPIACWLGTGGNDAMYGCVRDLESDTSYRTPSTSYKAALLGSASWGSCPSTWSSVSDLCP